ELFQGEPLDRALAWATSGRRRMTLSAGEQTFLDAAIARGRRRSRRRWAVVAGLLPVVLLLGFWQTFWQWNDADGRLEQAMAKVAASRAEALRLTDPVTARKLSLTAWRLAPIPEARRALTAADAAVAVFTDPWAGPRSLHAISGDGTRLAALEENTLRVYDLASGREIARTAGPAQSVRAMAWAPDGRTLALVGVDRSYLWDTASASVGPPFGRGLGAPGEQSAWFSPGGGLLFAAARQSGERWAWDLRARRAAFVGEYAVVGPDDRVALVFAGKRSEIRRTGRESRAASWLDRMPWEYTTFAPDGRRVAIAEESGIQIYGLDGVPTDYARLRPSPGYLRFSADGRLLASTDSDRVRVWRLNDGTLPDDDRAQPGGGTLIADRPVVATGVDRPAQAVFTPDGRRLRVLTGRGVVLTIALDPEPPPADHAAHICSRYGGLSPQEWAEHLPELPYREAC
ncbi:WD40 repeat domain-containing protein, partial [Nonomuraea basaltis]|uniref:WD40 repeat domain-containing protein n=1 Tax=Nonomuraea basaltis TaxID=2495887 RepID=UPI003B84B5B3